MKDKSPKQMKKDGYEFIGTVEEDDKVLDVLKRVKKYDEAKAIEFRRNAKEDGQRRENKERKRHQDGQAYRQLSRWQERDQPVYHDVFQRQI